MPTADPHGEMEAHHVAGVDPEWRCVNCGMLAPGRIASCDCATDCVYDRRTRRFDVKSYSEAETTCDACGGTGRKLVAVDPAPFGKLNVPNPDFLHEVFSDYEATRKR